MGLVKIAWNLLNHIEKILLKCCSDKFVEMFLAETDKVNLEILYMDIWFLCVFFVLVIDVWNIVFLQSMPWKSRNINIMGH